MLNFPSASRSSCAALLTVLTAALLVLAGCGGQNGAADSAEGAAEASAGARFAESLEDEPCTLLTPEVVSEVYGMPAAELEVSEYAGCDYSWNDSEMSIASIEVYENDESARSSFEASTRNMSAEEVDEATGRMEEPGATRSAAVAGEALGETAFSGGIQHDPVDGVGDDAAFYHTTLTVLKGNVTFNVEAYPPGADEAAKRDLAIRLARAVAEHMDEM